MNFAHPQVLQNSQILTAWSNSIDKWSFNDIKNELLNFSIYNLKLYKHIFRIKYKVEPDIEESCERAQCKHNSPKCLSDVLRANTVLIHSTCCCVGDLCSTWPEHTLHSLLNVKTKYFTTYCIFAFIIIFEFGLLFKFLSFFFKSKF